MNALTQILDSYPARQHFGVLFFKFENTDDAKNMLSWWAALGGYLQWSLTMGNNVAFVNLA